MTRDHPAAELPFFVNGTLGEADRRRVEAHVAACPTCRAELALWRDVSAAVRADARQASGVLAGPDARALARESESAHAWPRHPASPAHRTLDLPALVATQVGLIPGLWASSAIVMAIGFALAWMSGRAGAVGSVAPLVAAFSVSRLYGPQHDPAFELTAATPTSPRTVLLARLLLVFGYDLALALAASTAIGLVLPSTVIATVIWSWLAPMTFLSALALVCSVSIGSHAAVSLAFGLWLLRGVVAGIEFPARALSWAAAYQALWAESSWLFALAAVLLLWGIWLAGSGERRLPAPA